MYPDRIRRRPPMTTSKRLGAHTDSGSIERWLGLSEMKHDQGVLHVVPVPSAMAYLLIRPLLNDVPGD